MVDLIKFRQPKGKYSSIADDTLMKLHVHNSTMILYIQYKFQETPFIGYLVMAEDDIKSLKFRESQGDNSSITDGTAMNLHVHEHTLVIYIQYKV